jgi:hypothetical protein
LKGVDREAAEYDRVDRAQLSASQHGEGDLGNAAHIDRDAVALAYPKRLDDAGHA